MRKAAGRAGLIVFMFAGGLLTAGISQAQDIGSSDARERAAEAVAASGGPAPSDHLIAFSADRAAVDVRDDDVAAPAAPGGEAVPAAAPTAMALPEAEKEMSRSRQLAAAEPPRAPRR